ncbi:hypothetical protein HY968_00035 [Candidatus Kaiserbacteria bacterium]|nr:hypothetical protein [Candidatus Kaiserbacteria bacterium]
MSDVSDLPLRKHPAPHKEIARRYKDHFKDKDYRSAVLSSALVFIASVIASLAAGLFSKSHASNPVSDLVLSNIPVFQVDELFVYGTIILIVFVLILAFAHPKRIPFTLHTLALFFFIRAGFVTLTHIAPFPGRAATDFGATTQKYFFGDDLFFSGHTGTPFLLALIFWREWRLRYVFLAWSAYFAVVVLLGHLHYSIDVAAAFFITYTIFCMAEWLFPEYRALFLSDEMDGESSA